MKLVPYPKDLDVYGKDASKATSGKDTVYRIGLNKDGLPCRLTALSEEEAELARKPRRKKRKR